MALAGPGVTAMTEPTPGRHRGISEEVVVEHGIPGAPPLIACGVLVSPAERDWIDTVRLRSYELSVQRGHLRRYPA